MTKELLLNEVLNIQRNFQDIFDWFLKYFVRVLFMNLGTSELCLMIRVYSCFCMCLCIICVRMWVQVHVYMYAHVYRGQRPMLNVVSQVLFFSLSLFILSFSSSF